MTQDIKITIGEWSQIAQRGPGGEWLLRPADDAEALAELELQEKGEWPVKEYRWPEIATLITCAFHQQVLAQERGVRNR